MIRKANIFLMMLCVSLALHGAVFAFASGGRTTAGASEAKKGSILTHLVAARKAAKEQKAAHNAQVKPAQPKAAPLAMRAPEQAAAEAGEAEAAEETGATDGATDGAWGDAFDGPSQAYFDSLLERIKSRIASHLVYPAIAKQRNIEGAVGVYFEVEPDGACGALRVASTSDSAILDRAALALVKNIFPLSAVNLPNPKSFTVSIRYSLTEE
ncbi:MAG: TonB family protein [Spirochaetaceae bacterium]|jgi:TonB family protein|nr:TonB family protein [Spirochaetaceae bacterium]